MLKEDIRQERKKKLLKQNTLIEQFNNNWILSHTKKSHTTNAETNKNISNNDVISSSSVSSVKQSNMTCNECITELHKICVTDKVQLKYITLHLLEAARKYY